MNINIYEAYLTTLAVIVAIRCFLIIGYRLTNKRFKRFNKKGSFLNKYCKINKDDPWVYRLFGLSVLWLAVRYWESIEGLIK